MTLLNLAAVVETTGGIQRSDVVHYCCLGGYIPVKMELGHSTFHLRISNTGFYITVAGRIYAQDVYELLSRRASPELCQEKGAFLITDYAPQEPTP